MTAAAPRRRPLTGPVHCPGCGGYAGRVEPVTGGWRLICPICGPVLYRATLPQSDPIVIYVPRAKRRKHYPLQPPRRPGRPRKAPQ